MSRRIVLAEALAALAPRLPPFETEVVLDRALDSRGLRFAQPGEAAWLALVSYVRHAMTDYDALLAEGYDPESARFFVRDATAAALAGWGVRRPIAADHEDEGEPRAGSPRSR